MSISEELHSLLSDLALQIDQNQTISHYLNLSISEQNNSDFLSKYFCNNNGDFIINKFTCLCDLGMFGNHCQEKGIDLWGGNFTFFRCTFSFIYIILTSIFLITLIMKIAKDFHEKQLLKRILCTPKYLIFFNLIIFATSRLFFIVVDPFCQHQLITHKHDSMVFYMSVPALLGFYIEILIVWLGILAVFDLGLGKINNRCFTCMYSRIKIIGEIIMILLYPSQLITNYFSSMRKTTNGKRNIIIIFSAVCGFMLIILSLILIKNLKSKFNILYGEHKHEKEEYQTKVTTRAYHGDTRDNYENERKDEIKIQNKKDVIEFLMEANHYGLISVIESSVFGRESIQDDYLQNKSEMSSKVMKKNYTKAKSFKKENVVNQDDEINHFTKIFKSNNNDNDKVHYENSIIADNESDNEFLHETLNNNKTSRKKVNMDLIQSQLQSNEFLDVKKVSTYNNEGISDNKYTLNTHRSKHIRSKKSNKDFIINKEENFENRFNYETELHYLDIYHETTDPSITFSINNDKLTNTETNHLKYNLSSKKTQLQSQTNKILNSIYAKENQGIQVEQNPLTKKDKRIIYNIFTMSITFLALSFIIFYCCMFLNITPVLYSHSSQIVLLFILFTTEVANLILIYNLFFRDKQVQEYQSLKVISNLDKFLSSKDNEPSIVFDVFTTNKLYLRFKNFIKNYYQ